MGISVHLFFTDLWYFFHKSINILSQIFSILQNVNKKKQRKDGIQDMNPQERKGLHVGI